MMYYYVLKEIILFYHLIINFINETLSIYFCNNILPYYNNQNVITLSAYHTYKIQKKNPTTKSK